MMLLGYIKCNNSVSSKNSALEDNKLESLVIKIKAHKPGIIHNDQRLIILQESLSSRKFRHHRLCFLVVLGLLVAISVPRAQSWDSYHVIIRAVLADGPMVQG